MKHKLISLLGPTPIAALVVAAVAAFTGCNKEDPPPPLPPAQSAAAQEPFKLQAVDAGVEEIDAGAAPKGKGGKGGRGLKPCCAALKQNANLAPEPTKTYMMQAAAMCDAAAATGQGMQSALGMIAGALRGAQMPANCK